jgi:nucleoside 2-deoxyribosyltransferase
MPRLYFAAPLFSEAELAFNAMLAADIEALGFEVFLPQRDGVEKDREPYASMSPGARRRAIFETDRDAVFASDVLLFVLDGRVPDEGAAVELGLAYAHRAATGRPGTIIGLMTDSRAAFLGGRLNPMLSEALDAVHSDRAALMAALSALSR